MRTHVLAVLVAVSGCGPELTTDADLLVDDEQGTSQLGLSMSAADQALVLARVNDPRTTVELLNTNAGLDSRAAKGIVAARNGADGVAVTADDQPFATIAALDAVAYVGDSALSKVLTFAKREPASPDVTVENVRFAGWQAETVVWGVNTVPVGVLNGLLDNRAAANLIAARPYTSVAAIGAVALVGPNALTALRGQARPWWHAKQNAPASLAGTFDGVTFDETTAKKALELANTAAVDAMLTNGIFLAPANAIIAARPFTTLEQVAAVKGVGTSSMQALERWARVGAIDPGVEVAAIRARLEPLVANIWFPSETDARMLWVSSTGIGSAVIDDALIRQRLTSQHDALLPQVMWVDPGDVPLAKRTAVERRDAIAYLNRIIDNTDPADDVSMENARRFAVLRDALTAELTDVVLYRFGTVNISVFIVGRTPNGALVGFLTGQVET